MAARIRKGRFLPGESGNPATQFGPGNPTRFQPGQSGNSAGRPRSRVEADRAFSDALLGRCSPETAADLLAKAGEAWAIQQICQRISPVSQTLNLIHERKDDAGIDFSKLTDEQLTQLKQLRELLEAAPRPNERTGGASAPGLRRFIKDSWHVVRPSDPFLPNWHIDAIAEHLQAVYERQIQYLLINIGPGHAKSLLCAVQFPAWLWLKDPSYQLICGTYAHKLTVRDAVRCRDLITSPWYRETFEPNWDLKDDENEKDLYYNDLTGFRCSVSVTGQGTGIAVTG